MLALDLMEESAVMSSNAKVEKTQRPTRNANVQTETAITAPLGLKETLACDAATRSTCSLMLAASLDNVLILALREQLPQEEADMAEHACLLQCKPKLPLAFTFCCFLLPFNPF